MPVILRLLLISLAWVAIQIGAGFLTHHLPRRFLSTDGVLYRSRGWERGGRVYQQLFFIKRWKDRLPEAGALFSGGVSKRALPSKSPAGLGLLLEETRRAELTHWLPMLLSFSFFAWNPPHIAAWMPIVGVLGNAPFVMVQRYNRPRLEALVRRRERE